MSHIIADISSIEYMQRFDKVMLQSKKLTDNNFRLFHVSKAKLFELTTRLPDNKFTRSGDEENTIKRISVAPSIGDCLAALGNGIKDNDFYVYEPKDYKNITIVPNEFIIEHNLIPDAHITHECWVINPVLPVKCIGKISVKDRTGEYNEFEYHDESDKAINARMYYWNWDWKEVYHISFPYSEHKALLNRLNNNQSIWTTRVYDEYNKYRIGQVLVSDLNDRVLKVNNVYKFTNINRHPFYNQLSSKQKNLLIKAKLFDIIELQ